MLLFSKSISQLLLPPGGLILLALIGLIFWEKLWGRSLIALALCAFWLLSTAVVRDALTSSLESQYPAVDIANISITQPAVIVLLGGGIQENSLDYQGSNQLGIHAMMRTIYAAKIAQATSFAIYATGGAPLSPNSETEASVMQRWLLWFGVDKSRIYSENSARTTWENATLTKKLLQQKNMDTIILVTSAWHMPRSVWCFEAQGLTVIPAPTDYLTEHKTYDLRSFLPHWSAFADSSYALHEYLGLIWYKSQYTP